jgi:hypothetical protein
VATGLLGLVEDSAGRLSEVGEKVAAAQKTA